MWWLIGGLQIRSRECPNVPNMGTLVRDSGERGILSSGILSNGGKEDCGRKATIGSGQS